MSSFCYQWTLVDNSSLIYITPYHYRRLHRGIACERNFAVKLKVFTNWQIYTPPLVVFGEFPLGNWDTLEYGKAQPDPGP